MFFYTEQDANARSLSYFSKHFGSTYVESIWDFDSNDIFGYDLTQPYDSIRNRIVINTAFSPSRLIVF